MKKIGQITIATMVIAGVLIIRLPIVADETLIYGLTTDEVEYYAQFWGPLLDISQADYVALSSEDKKTILRQSLLAQYQTKKYLIEQYYPELTPTQQFIAFLMLRVNGSLPIYATHTPAKTLEEIIYKSSGACNAYALRLMFVLRTFGLEGNITGFAPPSIPGHVVVQIEHDGDALLIDANSNTLIVYPETEDTFFDTISKKTSEEIAKEIRIYSFPYYERDFLPNPQFEIDHFDTIENSSEYRNNVYTPALKNNWLKIFTTERDSLLSTLVIHTDLELANDRYIDEYAEFWNL